MEAQRSISADVDTPAVQLSRPAGQQQDEIRVLGISASSVTSAAEKENLLYPELDFIASSYARLQNPDKREAKQDNSAESSASRATNQSQDRGKSGKSDYITELRRLGYTNLTVDQLIDLKSHGVSIEFIEGLKSEGLTDLSVEHLLKLRAHGVQPDLIRSLKASGYSNLGIDQLLKLRMHGLTPQFVSEMGAAGFPRLPLESLLAARQHGVGPAFIKELQSLGYAQLSLEDVIKARRHGVDSNFIKELQSVWPQRRCL